MEFITSIRDAGWQEVITAIRNIRYVNCKKKGSGRNDNVI